MFFYFCIFLGASTLVRAAIDSDDEIFLMQNTFSQEPFSPELNLEELVGDFREVSERDSVEVEKKENPGRNIVVVCDTEVEKRRESRIPANTKVNTSWAVLYWDEWTIECNVKVKKNSSKEKYYEVNPQQKYKSTDEGMIPINIHHLQFGQKTIKMSVSFNGVNT